MLNNQARSALDAWRTEVWAANLYIRGPRLLKLGVAAGRLAARVMRAAVVVILLVMRQRGVCHSCNVLRRVRLERRARHARHVSLRGGGLACVGRGHTHQRAAAGRVPATQPAGRHGRAGQCSLPGVACCMASRWRVTRRAGGWPCSAGSKELSYHGRHRLRSLHGLIAATWFPVTAGFVWRLWQVCKPRTAGPPRSGDPRLPRPLSRCQPAS